MTSSFTPEVVSPSQPGAPHPHNSDLRTLNSISQSINYKIPGTEDNTQRTLLVQESVEIPTSNSNLNLQRAPGDHAGLWEPHQPVSPMPSHHIPDRTISPPAASDGSNLSLETINTINNDVRMISQQTGQIQDVGERSPGFDRRTRSCTSILKEKGTRRKLDRLIVCAIFLIIVLSVYLAFVLSATLWGPEVHVLLLFMILILVIVFCHSLIRFIMAVLRPTGSTTRIPSMVGPAGYAQPDRPIHVTFVGDEEIFAESHVPSREKVTVPPPAYGLWRSSVRINPDLLYWQRVEGHPPLPESFNRAGNSYGKPRIPRPPSYTSDDGIDYVVEVQPRSLTQFRSPEEQNQRR